jgi:PAS domain-containing protein
MAPGIPSFDLRSVKTRAVLMTAGIVAVLLAVFAACVLRFGDGGLVALIGAAALLAAVAAGLAWLGMSRILAPLSALPQLRASDAERNEVESRLRASEERYRRLIALSSDWYWEQDAELRFTATGGQSDALNLRLDAVEKRYRAQFAALDNMMSSMNSTSRFLTAQLASMSGTRG